MQAHAQPPAAMRPPSESTALLCCSGALQMQEHLLLCVGEQIAALLPQGQSQHSPLSLGP